MANERLKCFDDFSDESEAFDQRFETVTSSDSSEAERSEFLEEITEWVQACADHGRFISSASSDRRAFKSLLEYWNSRLRREGHLPEGLDRLADFDPTAGIPLTADCPYPGLDPYTAERRESFFGREVLIAEFVVHLEEQRILLMIGGSGSGKSSLALAGILPKLEERHKDSWLFAPKLTPGDHPLAALAASVAQVVGRQDRSQEIERSLAAKPYEALAQLADLCQGRPLMLLIDQFEELFTLCRDPAEQRTFTDALCALSEPSSVGPFACRILLTLRTDHLWRFEKSDALRPLYNRLISRGNAKQIAGISPEDMKRAIVEPARRVGLRFVPPNLVDQLANQTAGLANGLPLLQFALQRLWHTRPINDAGEPLDLITEAMVDALPNVRGALGTVANTLFEKFSPERRQICERLLQELVVLDETFEEPLRRRRDEAELRKLLEERFHGASADVAHVIDRFVDTGLLRCFGEGGTRRIEVAHEALLRHWDHIKQLLESGNVKERLHLVKQIGREAVEWVNRGSDDYLILRGERLERALEYDKDDWLAEAESAAYVRACRAREEKLKLEAEQAELARLRAQEAEREAERAKARELQARAAEAEAVAREATAKAKKRRFQLWLAISVAALVLVGSGAAYQTYTLQRIQMNRDANLNAFTSLSVSLPPWEALDVAKKAAELGGTGFRFALAHALERMEDTSLVGDERATDLSPNQDGSALLQFDRTRERLLIYPIGEDGKPGSTVAVALPGRLDLLASAHVGPPINGKNDDRLALLFFFARSLKDPGYVLEVHRLSPGKDERIAVDPTNLPHLASAREVSKINFVGSGTQAVFSAIDYQTLSSTIYRFDLDSSGRPKVEPLGYPLSAPGQGASVVSAVALGPKTDGAAPVLITGRLDGSVYCGPTPLQSGDRSPVKEIITLQEPNIFALRHQSGVVYAGSCSAGVKAQFNTDGTASEVNLTRMHVGSGVRPLLSFIDGQRLRCFVREHDKDDMWTELSCNPNHQVSQRILRQNGQQLTVEVSGIAAIQTYPVEYLARQGRTLEARYAGLTVVRWNLLRSAGQNDPRLQPADDPLADLPWKQVGANAWAADANKRLITSIALSPNGKKITWIEQRDTESHRDWLADLAPKEKRPISTVVRTWTIGTTAPAPLQKQLGKARIAAISDDGTLTYSQAPFDRKEEIYVDGRLIDRLEEDDFGVACLAFSPNGHWLVAGVEGGRVRAYALKRDARGVRNVESVPWIDPFATEKNEKSKRRPSAVTACAIGDNGALVVGFSGGEVVLRQPDGKLQQLTERAAFQFAAPVKAVTIDRQQRHVTALASWQPNNCSRPGLPGQTLRVWDLELPSDEGWRIPASNACFPNETVLAIGDLCLDNGNPAIPLVTASNTRWHKCPGCAQPNETAETMLERLLKDAEKAKAQALDPETLKDRYGLRFE